MTTSFYTASTGAMQLQKGMDVVANNIANVSTTGFKPSQGNFQDLVYTAMNGPTNDLKLGHGAKLSSTDVVHQNGSLNPTGRNLDFALTDRTAFFGVLTPNGMQYTRNGNFYLSEENGKAYLASDLGGYVVDANGNRIETDTKSLDEKMLEIGVFSFSNVDGLNQVGNTSFTPTAASGQAQRVQNPEILQGKLECSAVDIAQEMSGVIQLERAFQFNTRLVQMADEVSQTVNNLR